MLFVFPNVFPMTKLNDCLRRLSLKVIDNFLFLNYNQAKVELIKL